MIEKQNHSLQHSCFGLGDRHGERSSFLDTTLSVDVYISFLKDCISASRDSFFHAKRIYYHIRQHKVTLTGSLGYHLVAALAKSGALEEARHALFSLPQRSVYMWTALISGYTEHGQHKEALKLHDCMLKDGVEANGFTYMGLLKACAGALDPLKAKNLHDDLQAKGLIGDVFVGSALVSTYGRCGRLAEAGKVFEGLSQRNVVTWNAMISAYVEHGHCDSAVQLYRQMQDERVSSNAQTYLMTVKACTHLAAKHECNFEETRLLNRVPLEIGKALHADAWKQGLASYIPLIVSLITMYGKCCSVMEAENLFDALPWRDVVIWTAMITAYIGDNQPENALQFFDQMQGEGINPNEHSYAITAQACGILAEMEEAVAEQGQQIKFQSHQFVQALHYDVQNTDFATNTFVGNTLVTVYGKCRRLKEAECVFMRLTYRDATSWSAMMAAYSKQGQPVKALQLYRQMQDEGPVPLLNTFITVCQACGAFAEEIETSSLGGGFFCLETVWAFHADAHKMGFTSDSFLGNTLLNMYYKCGGIREAEFLFDGLFKCDSLPWNLMISLYIQGGYIMSSMHFFRQMQEEGYSPDQLTFVIILQAACTYGRREETKVVSSLSADEFFHEIGPAIHIDAQRRQFVFDAFVCSALVNMYRQHGYINRAENVFSSCFSWDVVLWNTMLSAYVDQGQGDKALYLYRQMHDVGIVAVDLTYAICLQACAALAQKEQNVDDSNVTESVNLNIGRSLHADAYRKGVAKDFVVANALINFYGMHGLVKDAENAFQGLSQGDISSWNVMLSQSFEWGEDKWVLQLYCQMKEEGIVGNDQTYVIAFQACGALAEKVKVSMKGEQQGDLLNICKALQIDAEREAVILCPFVSNTLMCTYSKCGSLKEAEKVFFSLTKRDMVSWNVMISAYVLHGQEEKALCMFRWLHNEGLSPDQQTFVIALQACSALAGKEEYFIEEQVKSTCLDIGRGLDHDLQKKSFMQDSFVVNTLICMYGKCGSILEAERLFDGMQQLNAVSWNAMISTYVRHGQGKKSLQLYCQMQKEGLVPNEQMYVIAFQACCCLVEEGEELWLTSLNICQALLLDVQRRDMMWDICINTSLIKFYGKCGSIKEAEILFGKLFEHDVTVWNTMLSLYAENGDQEKALLLYRQMVMEGFPPNPQSYSLAFNACCGDCDKYESYAMKGQINREMALDIGRAFHADAWKMGIVHYGSVGNSLVSMYGKCGSVKEAENTIDSFAIDARLWNFMIALYVEHSHGTKALQFFMQMHAEGVSPSRQALLSVLHVCHVLMKEDIIGRRKATRAEASEIIKAFHVDAQINGFGADVIIGSTLLSVYSKFGIIDEALNVFLALPHRDVVCWSAMIAAYTEQDQGELALATYYKMQEEDAALDEISLISVLHACSKTGKLDTCRELHFISIFAGYDSYPRLVSTLVSSYGSCASIGDAQAAFDSVYWPDTVIWNTCITGYAQVGDSQTSVEAFEEMQKAGVSPDWVTFISLVAACSHSGLVHNGVKLFVLMGRNYNIGLDLKHHVVLLDLFGRAGDFNSVEDILFRIPVQDDSSVWVCLLNACHSHRNVELGEWVFDQFIALGTEEVSPYVLMSNICAQEHINATWF